MKTRQWMKWTGLGLIALGAAFSLTFGIAETVGDEATAENGWIHFIPAAILVVLLYLGARHPFRVGLALLALAAVYAVLVAIAAAGGDADWAGLLLALPPLVSGALLVAGSRQPGQGSTRRPPPA